MIKNFPESIEACAAYYGNAADAMRTYLIDGHQRAAALPNRGPIRFTADGSLDPAIRAAYSEYGFYIFEELYCAAELDDLQQDMSRMRQQFPVEPGPKFRGRPLVALQAENVFKRDRTLAVGLHHWRV